MIDCYSCQHNQQPSATLPARERVFDDGSWRIAHAISSALPGWMVVVPRRHVLSMAELTAHEAATLGPLLVALSRALHRGLGARKTCLALSAEAEGFQHLHVHLVPRMEDLPRTDAAQRSSATWRSPPTSGSAPTRWVGWVVREPHPPVARRP